MDPEASDGRVAYVRFVEVELPAPAAPRLVIEMESRLRVILADPMDIGLSADFIAHVPTINLGVMELILAASTREFVKEWLEPYRLGI